MGKRNKRARTLLKKMNILNEIPDLQKAKKYGIEEQVNARICIEEENSVRIQKLKEAQEAEAKAAELKAKKEAELKAKKEAEAKAKKETPVKKTPRKRVSKTTRKKS